MIGIPKLTYASEWRFNMIILITGSSHTGKTNLAQKLLEKYKYPYLSIDHLKMGLIRSGNTALTPDDDKELTVYLWPIVCEIIKTAVENNQSLIIEGCYIPFDWKNYFDDAYLRDIRYLCLCFTKNYIEQHFSDIRKYENIIENRKYDDYPAGQMISENEENLKQCKRYGHSFILIDKEYPDLVNVIDI